MRMFEFCIQRRALEYVFGLFLWLVLAYMSEQDSRIEYPADNELNRIYSL